MAPAPDALVIRGTIAASILALAVALALARRQRPEYAPPVARMPHDAFPAGERAPLTAFYFTSRLCGACQETPGIVREAGEIPLVALWVHERPDLVRALGVRETPTLLLVDAERRIRYARAGNPTVGELAMYVEESLASGGGQRQGRGQNVGPGTGEGTGGRTVPTPQHRAGRSREAAGE